MFLCELDGYAPPGGGVRGKPTLTLAELDSRLRTFLLDVYHRRGCAETKTPPAERWDANGFLPRMLVTFGITWRRSFRAIWRSIGGSPGSSNRSIHVKDYMGIAPRSREIGRPDLRGLRVQRVTGCRDWAYGNPGQLFRQIGAASEDGDTQ
jgi:hypothetical protein